MQTIKKERKKWIFRRRLNGGRDGADLTERGRLFQILGSPKTRLTEGSCSLCSKAEWVT
jgi:hypothetical protein